MKPRSFSTLKTPLYLAVACLALGLPLAGCSGKSSAPDTSAGSTAGSGAGNAAGGAGGASSADGGSSSGGGSPTAGRRRMAQALMGLGLSADQKQQIRDIMRSARKQSLNADPETRRANYKAAFAKIDSLLTPDQRVKLHAKLGTMRGERGQSATSPS